MSSRRVVIARIGFYESAQVLLTQCDDMVNALEFLVAIRGTADIDGRVASAMSVEFDPQRHRRGNFAVTHNAALW